MDYAVKTVKQILAADKPLFGICLGHQLLATFTTLFFAAAFPPCAFAIINSR